MRECTICADKAPRSQLFNKGHAGNLALAGPRVQYSRRLDRERDAVAAYVRYDPSSSQADPGEGLQPLPRWLARSFRGSLSRMRRAARGEGPGLRVRVIRLQRKLAQGVRWYVVALAVAIVIAGLLVAVSTSGNVRWGLFGLFAGTGLGLLVTELISALSRRDEEERNRKLLEPARARVRAAFRVAEFSERAIDASAGGEVGNRHLDQFLLNSEALGFRGALLDSMSALRGLETSDARRTGLQLIERAVRFAGNDAAAFRELQADLEWLHRALSIAKADDEVIIKDPELREPIRLRVRRNLEWAERYTDDVAVVRAWDNVFRLWDRDALSYHEASMLVIGFQAFLAFVGADHLGFERWKHVVRGISEVGLLFRPSPGPIHDRWVRPIVADIELGWKI
jgi:hypothetical protein